MERIRRISLGVEDHERTEDRQEQNGCDEADPDLAELDASAPLDQDAQGGEDAQGAERAERWSRMVMMSMG